MSFANQPADFTLIEDFDASQFPVWPNHAPNAFWSDEFGNNGGTVSAVADATAPQPTGLVDNTYLSMDFKPSLGVGSAPGSLLRDFQPTEQYRRVFIGFWLRHDIGWDNNPPPLVKSGVKLMWLGADTAVGSFYCGHDHSTMDFSCIQQGQVDRQMSANMNVASASLQGRIGSWAKYELLFGMSSNDATADGTVDVWIDGVQTHHYTDVRFNGPDSGARVWNSFKWNPTFGGGGSPPEHDQFQSISHIRLMGSNP